MRYTLPNAQRSLERLEREIATLAEATTNYALAVPTGEKRNVVTDTYIGLCVARDSLRQARDAIADLRIKQMRDSQ